MELRQYKIVTVNLDPTIGSEIKKTRPCVIISPNEMNEHLSTLVIAPMTSNKRKYPTRVKVNYEGKIGMVVLDQIRTIDKRRIVNVGGEISTKEIAALKLVLKKTYVE